MCRITKGDGRILAPGFCLNSKQEDAVIINEILLRAVMIQNSEIS